MNLRQIFEPLLDKEYILDSPEDLAFYGRDSCRNFEGSAALILRPNAIHEVQQIVKTAIKHKISLVPSGGRSGYSGGATAACGEVVVSFERMNKILNFNAVERTVVCQAGVITAKLQHYAQEQGLYYPVNFSSSGSSQIGGNIATNAGGIKVLRYGLTRSWVAGVKVITGSGEMLDTGRRLIKDQSGYSLKDLFIGSEGTLGFIVEASMRLTRPPPQRSVIFCGLKDDDSLLDLFCAVRESNLTLSAFEFLERSALELVCQHFKRRDPFSLKYPCYVLAEFEHESKDASLEISVLFEKLRARKLAEDALLSDNSKQFEELWQFRDGISEAVRSSGLHHRNDLSLPLTKIPEGLLALQKLYGGLYSGVRVLLYGHLGDGNIHVNILKPPDLEAKAFYARCASADQEVCALIKRLEGSISAEHGVGLLKKPHLSFCRSQSEIEYMREIKRVFDPHGIFNPGKIFD